jgi:quinol monooxygenase YgiN
VGGSTQTLGSNKTMFVQIVKFKLKQDTSRESFLDLTEQMIDWLKNKTGFIAYELYEGTEFWSDRIAWENEEFAQDGLKNFLDTAIAKKMIHLVEDGHSSFFGQAVASAQLEQSSPTLRSNMTRLRRAP